MTYKEAEIYRDSNRANLIDRIPGLTYRSVVIATDNSDLRARIRIHQKITQEGLNNNFILREAHEPDSDWGVFVICENTDLTPAVVPLKQYLAYQKPS